MNGGISKYYSICTLRERHQLTVWCRRDNEESSPRAAGTYRRGFCFCYEVCTPKGMYPHIGNYLIASIPRSLYDFIMANRSTICEIAGDFAATWVTQFENYFQNSDCHRQADTENFGEVMATTLRTQRREEL